MDEKYIVYANDLKYRKYRNIKKEKVIFDSADTESLFDIDLDTIEYRVNECKNDKYQYLDLNYLDINELSTFPKVIMQRLHHLSLMGNNLSDMPDLSLFICLEVLNLSHNKITKLNKIPSTLIEIDLSYNNIESLDSLVGSKLKRIKCTHNKINIFPELENLELLHCQNNNISIIPKLLNIRKIYAMNNNIIKLYPNNTLKLFDGRNNKLSTIPIMNKLEELYISGNNLTEIPCIDGLIILECLFNNINKITYISTLKELVCDYKQDLSISNKYKIEESKICEKNLILRFITT